MASYVTSALDIQSCCNELAFWALRADAYSDAYDGWYAAFCHRNTPPNVHDDDWCDALELIGLSLHLDTRSAEATAYLEKALAYKEKTLPHSDKRLFEALVRIVRALVAQNKHEEAEAYFRRALDGYRQLFPEEHEGVLQISIEFAYSLACQGTSRAVREAEKLARRSLKTRERFLGRLQQATVESVWTLGFVVEKAGRRGDARHLYERAYREGCTLLGDQHVDVRDYGADCDRMDREDGETVQYLLL
jgi:tetratricopeptide (TPR) repeat protein